MRRLFGLGTAILLLAMFVPGRGMAATTAAARTRTVDAKASLLPPDYKMPDLQVGDARRELRAERQASSGQAASVVGDEKVWLALDDFTQELYPKAYTLRGVGDHTEVWVASDADDISVNTDFPADDCRNGVRTEITDAQVDYLIGEFDGNIYPKESETFSVPPERDGVGAPLAELLELPPDYYEGEGDNIVVLIDNVRDDNFYDTDNAHGFSYIAGFYASFFDDLVNRLVMSIDAFDWLHRTGANPPHDPSTDLCTSAPARPFLYEGVFAHEYQHLLMNYEDPGETSWVNEGISDWAQTLTGYVDPSIPITDLGSDSHIQCFLGWLGVQTEFNPIPRDGGPENSLTLWGDQTDFEWEILCDYGAAYSMMELLADRFGPDFMGAFHRDDLHGFESLQGLLDGEAGGLTIRRLIDRWAAMAALDGVLDDGAKLKGGRRATYQVSTLDASINWDTTQAYDSPGAPPNGSDYVRLRDASGYLSARQIEQISFDGVSELPPLPLEWVVDPNPPAQPGDPAFFAGNDDNLDRSIVQQVAVTAGSPVLTLDGSWNLEPGFDYGYVQISTDGGESYSSIECSNQVPGGGPLGPAFNGDSGGVVAVSCDLSAYAGTTIVLAFRMVTDGSIHTGGFWVDDSASAGTVLSDGSTLEGWTSATEFNPIDVEGYTVRLVAIRGDQRVWLGKIDLNRNFDRNVTGKRLRDKIGRRAELVAAIVTYHDSTEQVLQYAPYTLTVNGFEQPGG
jgi:Immune inhibitor A peptidase M6